MKISKHETKARAPWNGVENIHDRTPWQIEEHLELVDVISQRQVEERKSNHGKQRKN